MTFTNTVFTRFTVIQKCQYPKVVSVSNLILTLKATTKRFEEAKNGERYIYDSL